MSFTVLLITALIFLGCMILTYAITKKICRNKYLGDENNMLAHNISLEMKNSSLQVKITTLKAEINRAKILLEMVKVQDVD